MDGTELPVRFYDTPAGIVARCLCGAEGARVTLAPERASAIVRAAHGTGVRNRGVSADVSPAGLLRLAVHARRCVRGQNAAREAAASAGGGR